MYTKQVVLPQSQRKLVHSQNASECSEQFGFIVSWCTVGWFLAAKKKKKRKRNSQAVPGCTQHGENEPLKPMLTVLVPTVPDFNSTITILGNQQALRTN